MLESKRDESLSKTVCYIRWGQSEVKKGSWQKDKVEIEWEKGASKFTLEDFTLGSNSVIPILPFFSFFFFIYFFILVIIPKTFFSYKKYLGSVILRSFAKLWPRGIQILEDPCISCEFKSRDLVQGRDEGWKKERGTEME